MNKSEPANAIRLIIFLLVCVAMQGATTAMEIKVDQVGYLPAGPKFAMVVLAGQQTNTAMRFSLRRAKDNSVVFQGPLGAAALDRDTGDQVQTADFSKVKESGTFYLDVPDIGRSWDFRIADDVFARTYYLAARSYYGQRCGTAVDLGPEFPGYRHGVCHTDGAYDPSSGKQGQHVSSHGWHDAGDYGRYVVNSGISTGTLLWTFDLFRQGVQKISLRLPESGHGVPDLLSEARWNIDWMLTMQDGDGGVWHKQTSSHFCGFIMPEADKLTSLVIGAGRSPFKTSCATADFAAVTSIAARVFSPFDPAYAKKCLAASQSAWNWLKQNPDVAFRNPSGISTGDYGDAHCDDERLWAAAELLRATGEAQYESYFLAHYRDYLSTIRSDNPPSWPMIAPLALWTYVLGGGKNAAAVNDIRQRSTAAADAIVERAASHPYRITMTAKNYIWGSNGVAANYSMQLLIADKLQSNSRYRDAAVENLHYLLGRNTFSLSWVTQTGSNAVQHIHHRLSAADEIATPWPGLLAGGPNPGRQDSVMQKLVPADTLPGKAYIDVEAAYACNEVAINWNAPLVFSLAAVLP
ncbi:MAG: glycoside hydrolase family 9 protein [Acidobacteriaceae bacterium]|nr:glycoside hydrolase family 9 protein [Acidobacteriaceae bacterium]